jgi:hypothetical protein
MSYYSLMKLTLHRSLIFLIESIKMINPPLIKLFHLIIIKYIDTMWWSK